MSTVPQKIDLLPEHLIDQIKAGEVIERPGNLIKEILENAVDAGTTRLELTIRNNGLDLISLKDNGHGMSPEDLPLAFARHATSKISRFEDLYQLNSFGFRGEALASISAISRLQCITKTAASKFASELRIEGGETLFQGERQTSTVEHGTELIIQDLFYNTPARLKFIQSQQSEKTFIKKILFAFILSRPEIEFQVKWDEGDKDIYPARENLRDRLRDLFPKAQNSIIYTQKFYENLELDVYLIPASHKGPMKFQNIFINNRYILDKQLHRVMTNAIEATFGGEDFHYVAYFFLPPDSIDVNVHPNKTIIKVMESSKMISLLSSTIKELGSKRAHSETPGTFPSSPMPSAQTFFDDRTNGISLQQERHQYNMEGVFSPHNLPEAGSDDLLWIDSFFLKKINNLWLAVSATKLLELYVFSRMKTLSATIPLLVSEPFLAKNVSPEKIQLLNQGGAEIEYLGADTLVLRGIPEWMNGFPLKEIIGALLEGKSFSNLEISPRDWSQSTWEEMLEFFPIDILINGKVVLDLASVLKEKLK